MSEVVPISFADRSPIREVASGVDALYLSGRASLPADLIAQLEDARNEATRLGQPTPLRVGDVDLAMAPHAFHRYHYSLDHPYGRIGATLSSSLPAFHIQPRAEFLHGVGPREAARWFQRLLEEVAGPVLMSVSRLDLFADFQGWEFDGDSRREFLCRAKSRHVYEEDETFNGLTFGTRASGLISARIYNKTIQSAKVGSGYWQFIWTNGYDPEQSVLRIEFELGRNALRSFGVSSPDETLDAAGSIWAYLTTQWLSHRIPTFDQTKSRWPFSPEWDAVRRAAIREDANGINRMYLGKRRGSVEILMPMLVGYLSSFGALADKYSLDDMIPELREFVKQHERNTGVPIEERVSGKRRKFGLP